MTTSSRRPQWASCSTATRDTYEAGSDRPPSYCQEESGAPGPEATTRANRHLGDSARHEGFGRRLNVILSTPEASLHQLLDRRLGTEVGG